MEISKAAEMIKKESYIKGVGEEENIILLLAETKGLNLLTARRLLYDKRPN
ncbi:hypothetical protein [Bacillus massilinigeriensis]|uniref:hypothetical protein n=1 Tax=Bacillus mediterraneensis TaxID=1805474 RepID=UPI0013563D65|nr:hypothetical protein [Bacillus mediterraneensis]